MSIASTLVVVIVALMHLGFMTLEIFFWDKPAGLKAFNLDPAFASATRVMAANQGVYNGFLAVGLLWGAWLGTSGFGIKAFCLSCVVIAGVVGAITAHVKILVIQALPAAVGLVLLCLAQ